MTATTWVLKLLIDDPLGPPQWLHKNGDVELWMHTLVPDSTLLRFKTESEARCHDCPEGTKGIATPEPYPYKADWHTLGGIADT